mmetsp:Transcript_52341/g.124969  ORF Transcript_52341/g.124969 Transcript_52341/m.124969 type:complete len:457 (+) Transcript_52341:77-1447(+)|eukprot:CAMPEP_0178405392 /NCGR_PEP_ID=MMETSP0689_2-20121128/18374_1 /TAXON_ID=160604 /ORGANISM="Amphidinium massartii, Strain CS-259" /LENGTH=456 /DNA_ID=CAMNT_0020026403 /DNA_START=62 /DNA_END=1432 /DNA_ORIENTATION=+
MASSPPPSALNDPFITNQYPAAAPTSGSAPGSQPGSARSPPMAPPGSYGQPPYQQPPPLRQQPGMPPPPYPLPPPVPQPGDVAVGADPFMAHQRPGSAAALENDPFLTHDVRFMGRHSERSISGRMAAAAAAISNFSPFTDFSNELQVLMGEVDPMASPWCGMIYVYIPMAVFLVTLLLLLVLQHFSFMMTVIFLVGISLAAVVVIAIGFLGKRMGEVSFVTLGLLCLVAVALGGVSGYVGWTRGSVRLSWWYSHGGHFQDITATTDSRSVIDAASLRFDGQSRVDSQRSAGYVGDGSTFCVAPVLSEASSTTIGRVHFWAVGLNCCDGLGGFTCDASRDAGANQGVVMLDGGNPCPGCNADGFAQAILKAEASHNLVSADGALMMRWVSDAGAYHRWLVVRILLFVFASVLISFLVLAVLGHMANQFGWGRTPFGTYDLRADFMKVDHRRHHASY